MRCPDCMKFVGLETEVPEPDVDLEIEFDEDGASLSLGGIVRVVRNCAECGQELKGADFDIALYDVAVVGAPVPEAERENVTASAEVSEPESGGGRYKKNLVGFSGTATVMLGERVLASVTVEDNMAASQFEESV
jgi:hypothetical protein